MFLDFDGTITRRDVTDAILDAFADPAWLQIEQEWLAGRIGSRACLTAQMALVTATREHMDRLLDVIDIDPDVATLLDVCAARATPVYVVSDGFDYCIDRILRRPGLNLSARMSESRIVSSSLRSDGVRWRTAFPHPPESCVHGCATCKPAAMQRLKAAGAVAVFVGDGVSDRHAARCADVVFAKDKLAAFCGNAAIPYVPYATLATVANDLERMLEAGLWLPRSASRKASPAV